MCTRFPVACLCYGCMRAWALHCGCMGAENRQLGQKYQHGARPPYGVNSKAAQHREPHLCGLIYVVRLCFDPDGGLSSVLLSLPQPSFWHSVAASVIATALMEPRHRQQCICFPTSATPHFSFLCLSGLSEAQGVDTLSQQAPSVVCKCTLKRPNETADSALVPRPTSRRKFTEGLIADIQGASRRWRRG